MAQATTTTNEHLASFLRAAAVVVDQGLIDSPRLLGELASFLLTTAVNMIDPSNRNMQLACGEEFFEGIHCDPPSEKLTSALQRAISLERAADATEST